VLRKNTKIKNSVFITPPKKIYVKLIFIKGNQKVQQQIALMGYAILYALWEAQYSGRKIRVTVFYTFLLRGRNISK